MDLGMEMDLNLDKKTCEMCGGDLAITHFDMNRLYYKCEHCGDETVYAFKSAEEAEFYANELKRELFFRLREGFSDWQRTNWDELHKDFIQAINKQPELEKNLQIQMGLIACLTKGFRQMDDVNYQQCKRLFKIVDKTYKQRLKALRAQAKNPVLSDSIQSYQMSREQYVALRNEYLQTKKIYKLLWSLLKYFLK